MLTICGRSRFAIGRSSDQCANRLPQSMPTLCCGRLRGPLRVNRYMNFNHTSGVPSKRTCKAEDSFLTHSDQKAGHLWLRVAYFHRYHYTPRTRGEGVAKPNRGVEFPAARSNLDAFSAKLFDAPRERYEPPPQSSPFQGEEGVSSPLCRDESLSARRSRFSPPERGRDRVGVRRLTGMIEVAINEG
jgi:hypothetical protein